MRHIVVALSIAALAAGAAHAQITPHPSKAERLAVALGLETQLAALQEASLAQVRAQMAQTIDTLRRARVAQESLDEASQFFDEYARKVSDSWSPREAATVYVSALAEDMTDEEIEDAIGFYSTPEGQKANAAITNATNKLFQYIASKTEPVSRAEMDRFMKRAAERFKKAPSRPKPQ